MYRWWVFVHLVGVFGFLAAHGVSMSVAFRLRRERDPRKVTDLLQLSASTAKGMYVSVVVLLVGGVVGGFVGHWWGAGWIWAALGLLILITLAMLGMARPYYRRVGFVARAMAEGETSISQDQFDQVLRSSRGVWVIGIGIGGLVAILYLMLFKPTLGFSSTSATPTPPVSGPSVTIAASELAFDVTTVQAPAGTAFTIVFDNKAAGVPHNVSIYTDSSASTPLFQGKIVTGPITTTYQVRALDPGTYFFRCDVHPTQMTGDLVVK
jgi:plastocyanin